MKKLYCIAGMLLICVLLTGCREERKWRIGVSQCSSDDWRDKMNGEIGREMLFHEDAEVEIRLPMTTVADRSRTCAILSTTDLT